MNKTSTIQIIIVILMAVVPLMAFSWLLGLVLQPQTAAAQGGPQFTPAPLVAFGLTHPVLNINNTDNFDLQIVKTSDVTSVPSGTEVTYRMTITNLGPDPAQYFYVYDDVPPQLQNISYTFSPNVTVLSNNAPDPTALQWLVTSPLLKDDSMMITMTGELTSGIDARVINTAIVTPFVTTADQIGSNNSSSWLVDVIGYNFVLYFPIVQRFPTPTPNPILFQDFFNDDDSGWAEGDFGKCSAEYRDNQYRIVVDEDEDCFLPAPRAAEFRYAKVEAIAQRSGDNDEFSYGVYMNGQGGSIYYLFRVDANRDDCNWRLVRNTSTRRSGDCDAIFNGYRNPNKLAIKHTAGGSVQVYLNDKLLDTFNDGSELTGRGTGLYARSDTGDNVTIRFDNFTVYAP